MVVANLMLLNCFLWASILVVVVVDGFSCCSCNSCFWTAQHRRQQTIFSSTNLFLSSPEGEGGRYNQDTTGRSIGDVVQGLHGSKYQFSDAGAINFEGQRFAEMSYASNDCDDDDDDNQENYEDEPIPNWALKLLEEKQQNFPIINSNCQELILGSGSGSGSSSSSTCVVSIQNEERSWEKYYVFIIGTIDDVSSYSIQPRVGMLAPRGFAAGNGNNNNNKFSDEATITITGTVKPEDDAWLLLCTEADTWIYKLR